MTNKLKMLLCALLSLALISGMCAAEVSAFDVRDQVGRELHFDAPAERIVSCYCISTATLVALGLEDKLVGIEMKADSRPLYALAAPQIVSLPAVGSGKGVNIEEIAALNPDVVILPKKLREEAGALEVLGIPTVVVNPESQEEFEACVALLGQVCGAEEAAGALLNRYREMTAAVEDAVAGCDRPSVYIAAGSDFLTTYPSGLYQSDLIEIAGGVNVAAELDGDAKAAIGVEQLLAWNPDYIFIVADADYGVEDVACDARFAALSAVRNGRICAFPADIEAWDYPTPSSVLGQLYMASVLHPEQVSAETFLAEATAFYADVFGFDARECLS